MISQGILVPQFNETITALNVVANQLRYTKEDGNIDTVDLSLYLDDTNLSRITSGILDQNTGIATFVRDDGSSFTLNLSNLRQESPWNNPDGTVANQASTDINTNGRVSINTTDVDAVNDGGYYLNVDGQLKAKSRLALAPTSGDFAKRFKIFHQDTETAFQRQDTGDLLKLKQDGQIELPQYGAGTFDSASPTRILAVLADGSIVEVPISDLAKLTDNSIMCYWAEESSRLNNNSVEWSLGNGATGFIGVPFPYEMEILAVSFHARTATNGNPVVMDVLNAANNATIYRFTTSNAASSRIIYSDVLASPITIPAGTLVGFKTISRVGNVSNARVAIWARRKL